MDSLASAYEELEEWKAAVALRDECVARQTRRKGPLDADTLHQRIWLASDCFWAEDKDRRRAEMDGLERDLGVLLSRGELLDPKILKQFLSFGRDYNEANEVEKAVRWYQDAGRAFGTDQERFTKAPQAAADFILDMAENYARQGRAPDAFEWYERYVNALHAWKQTDGSPLNTYMLSLRELIQQSQRPEDLIRLDAILSKYTPYVRQHEPNSWHKHGRNPMENLLAASLADLGLCRLKQGKWAEAEAPLRESLKFNLVWLSELWTTYQAQSLLGGSLLGQKKYAEAEDELLEGFEGLKERFAQMPEKERASEMGQAADRLIALYTATNRPEEAKKWQAEREKYSEVDPASATTE